jgi:HSP20 family protein
LNLNEGMCIQKNMNTAVIIGPCGGLRRFENVVTRLTTEPRSNGPWSPSVDIFETEEALKLKVDLPDVKAEDIDVRVEHQTLTLRGQRKFEKEANVKGYHRTERNYGEFFRSFAVPSTVDTENVQADYKNGVLTITLPKKEAAKPRQVRVAVQDGDAKTQ